MAWPVNCLLCPLYCQPVAIIRSVCVMPRQDTVLAAYQATSPVPVSCPAHHACQ